MGGATRLPPCMFFMECRETSITLHKKAKKSENLLVKKRFNQFVYLINC
jgi:hypothetical protein